MAIKCATDHGTDDDDIRGIGIGNPQFNPIYLYTNSIQLNPVTELRQFNSIQRSELD